MKTILNKLCAMVVAVALITVPVTGSSGNLDAEMQDMFSSMGTIGNVTSPGAFHGQTMNIYSGGQLMMRTPGINYTLAHIELPHLNAGCGGIDMFAGSFSFITKAQFIAMLKQIGSAAAGYAFKLALKSLCPVCDQTITELQAIADKVNSASINSCEAGEALVNTIAGSWQKQYQEGCENIGQYLGSVADRADGRDSCRTNKVAVAQSADASGDPHQKAEVFTKGNVMWNALKKVGGLIDDDERQLIMSMTGTFVLTPPDATGSGAGYQFYDKLIESAQVLSLGSAASATIGKVSMTVYRCDEFAECLNPTETTLDVEPFVTKVERMMTSISNKISSRAAVTPPEIGFINQTRLPVWRMLSIGNTIPGSFVAETLIESYKEVIALDYTEAFLRRGLREAKKMLANGESRTKVENEFALRIAANIEQTTTALTHEILKVEAQHGNIEGMASSLNRMETSMRAQLPQNVLSMIEHSKAGIAGSLR